MQRISWVVGFVLGLEAAAFAQGAPPPVTDAAHDPAFVTMDRFDGSSRFGGELSYVFPDHVPGSITALRFDVHGQYVDPVSGFGGYAAMPFSHVSVSDMGMSQSGTGIGDAEAGVLYVPHLASPDTAVVLHAGITLPTGSSGTSSNDYAANLLGVSSRFNDLWQIIPEGFSIRLGASGLYRSGQMFARVDFGIDSNQSAANNVNAKPIMRFNAGVGMDLGQAAIMAETVNLYETDSNSNESGSSWVNTAAVSARFQAGTLQPYGAIVFPIDHDANAFMSAALTVGLEGLIR